VHVEKHSGPGQTKERSAALEKHLCFARNLHIDTHVLKGNDVARTIVDFARERNITQIFLGRAGARAIWGGVGSTVHKVVRLARDREITIVAERLR
jgi:K+-sensing histidine kinase KdpD